MGFKKSDLTPEMLRRMDEAEQRYYAQGGLVTRERYQIETPWVDRKLAGRVGRLEREEQGTFAQWLNQNGWKDCYVFHGLHKATTCKAGVPDFVVPTKSGTLWIEFKAAGGKLSLPQQNFEIGLEQHGQKLFVVYTALEAIELVKKQTSQRKD